VVIMGLIVYNTLSKTLESFVPLRQNEVKMYVCGPTVYDFVHIGNARAFVVADVIRRYFEYKGFNVKLVCNITDIDDKIIKKAKETGMSVQQIGEFFTEAYLVDMTRLNVKEVYARPRATKHIPEIIETIEVLIKKGYAYEEGGNVYFDVTKFLEYGKLSGNKAEALKMGARIDVDPKKRNPADFVLWKTCKLGEPAWYSPWGKGRPGWHIECSTMATKYLGETFDIHMGGKDLIFPHHENEIAQAEAVTGKPFARYWLHNEWLTVNGEKMSKSLGNFVTIRDAFKFCEPMVLRFFLISAHYRSPIDFNNEALKVAETNLKRLLNALERFEGLVESETRTLDEEKICSTIEDAKRRFEEAMDDDFNTPLAISTLFDIAKSIFNYLENNSEINLQTKEYVLKTFKDLMNVLGIKVFTAETRTEETNLVKSLLQLIIDLRKEMKEIRQWEAADKIRSRLLNLGVELEDMPEGTRWKMRKTN